MPMKLTTLPSASMPWTWKTDFQTSRPTVVTICITGSSESGGLNSTHIHGTRVPVEEPSTASITAQKEFQAGRIISQMSPSGRQSDFTLPFNCPIIRSITRLPKP